MLSFARQNFKYSNSVIGLFYTSKKIREDTFLVYDFFRYLDDIIDDHRIDIITKKTTIISWYQAIDSWDKNNLPDNLLKIIDRYNINPLWIKNFLRGMEMDIEKSRFNNFQELEDYCYCVATSVGFICAKIFSAYNAETVDYIKHLGLALQLTNILRDISEDARMNRIYIPLDELHQFQVSDTDILNYHFSLSMRNLLKHQIHRIYSIFQQAENSWLLLTINNKKNIRPARLMQKYYESILNYIALQENIFSSTVALPFSQKVRLFIQVFFV